MLHIFLSMNESDIWTRGGFQKPTACTHEKCSLIYLPLGRKCASSPSRKILQSTWRMPWVFQYFACLITVGIHVKSLTLDWLITFKVAKTIRARINLRKLYVVFVYFQENSVKQLWYVCFESFVRMKADCDSAFLSCIKLNWCHCLRWYATRIT